MFHRRLARGYETLPARHKAMIQLAMADLVVRRLTGEAAISHAARRADVERDVRKAASYARPP